jgi:hypothetical protein
MRFNAALPAVVAGAFLVAACGGGSMDSSNNGSTTTTSNSSGGGSSSAPSCPQTTIAGGDLFVAQQGPVGVALQSTGGLSQYTLTFLYDNVFGISTNNQQDKWGSTTLFGSGTSAGASTQVQLQPFTGFVNGEQTPSTFPKGIPVELWLTKNDGNQPGPANSSSTASIGKDIPHDFWHTASVTYAANSTATVTFFPSDPATFSVTLTNVKGAGSPTGPGC